MRIDKVKFATELARADVSVKELAIRTGVSRVTISAIKSGKSCANDTAKKLAAGLGVAVADLVQQ
ncbi:helix-turn-helix transcriptional regulator [Oscillibacter sp. ER4]|uniref:helix-turn-helix transcriptional regulator n=1 Tax=Oscillibacter sp. ER4 TaxID=1519439 RepID=UPI00051AC93C|nr:helix-turn-helix transcriptional regulator [Oscillibacter sp. ER4]